jgi:hypothetical protein
VPKPEPKKDVLEIDWLKERRMRRDDEKKGSGGIGASIEVNLSTSMFSRESRAKILRDRARRYESKAK